MPKNNTSSPFPLKRPEQSFIFQATNPTVSPTPSSKHPLSLYFVFSDHSSSKEIAKQIAKQIAMPSLELGLEKHVRIANFKAKPGQILLMVEQGLILGGLGKHSCWHPEQVCELLCMLGKKLIHFKDISLEIHLTEDFLEAIRTHQDKENDFVSRLSIDFKRKAKPKPIQKKEKSEKKEGINNEEKPETSDPDFISKLDTSDMLSQLVVCLNLGAEPMELLKTKVVKKKIIPVSTHISTLSRDLVDKAVLRGKLLSNVLHGARYIASLPGNHMNPDHYEKYARDLAKEYKLHIEVFDKSALKRLGCGGILAVGQGSVVDPRMIALQYKPSVPKVKRPLVLVGKGITFDTGGISLKPPTAMHEMKYDMCGSALALHSIAFAAAHKLSLPVIALLGIAENMPDGYAIKPGDVYTAYDGSTVEVQNTDAEGRLVLGDILAYASLNYDPLCMLDFATLTGACVIALGYEAAGVMTASEDLAKRVQDASLRSLDRVWRLPHWSVYGDGLKSEIADQRNIAGKGAGTVSAMRFLSRFVQADIPWAHFDIAGAAWREKGYGSQGRGATGWGVRLLSCFMEDLVA